jgi:hypothetical protein
MIRSILSAWVCIFWALWLGGLGALFLIAIQLFSTDRDLGIQAAPIIFQVFEKYQILLAAAALIATAAWRIASGSIRVTVLFCFLALAAAAAALEPLALTRPMERLRLTGQTDSPQFKKLHGESMAVYLGETVVLLIGGFFLPWAMQPPSSKSEK